MRLISQDGNGDMPYDGYVFRVNDNVIVASKDILSNSRSVVAVYTSNKKAIKAMDMLHKNYLDYCCNYHAQSGIFKFPLDSEIEESEE